MPAPGSVIVTGLAIFFEHTGIYAGAGQIIHRDGDGFVAAVDRLAFQRRLDGLNPSSESYVACRNRTPLRLPQALQRAKEALELFRHPQHNGYDLLNKNCHHFTRYCLTGKSYEKGLDFTFNSIQELLIKEFGVNCWRRCKC